LPPRGATVHALNRKSVKNKEFPVPLYWVSLSRTMLRLRASDTCHVTKVAIFENSRWRTAAILKMVSSLYLSRGSSDFNEIWCATADFGSKDGHVTKYQNFANSKRRTVAILKIVFGYIWTIYCPINVKFDTKKHNYVQIQVIWPKYQNLKIQDGGRSPFWKWFHHYISAADHPISMKFGA